MPFIIARVSTLITKEQKTELKSRLGKAIELVPGKSEEYLLLGFEDTYLLYLCGDNCEPTAYIEASIFGNENHFGYKEFTAEVTRIFNEVSLPTESISNSATSPLGVLAAYISTGE